MSPTLHSGDWLVVHWDAVPRVGDVVVARRPDRPGLLVVKRVVKTTARGFWLEGDDPSASDDSRLFGEVHSSEVLARAVGRYWPNPTRLTGRSAHSH